MDGVAVVTGASGGIGYETALGLARAGYRTYATMRDTARGAPLQERAEEENLEIELSRLDVDDFDSARDVIDGIISSEGRLDVLVNNAGYGMIGATENVKVSEFKAQFETNFFGIVNLIQGVLPAMREQRSGHIINISSVAGRIGFPASPAYVSSKFALEGFSECLRYELDPFGIRVVLIEPGVIKTGFFDSMRVATGAADSAHYAITKKVLDGLSMMVEMATMPDEVARAVIRAVREANPQPRYHVGNDAAMFLEARRLKTDAEFEEYMKKELF